jgi:MFS family permease
MVPVAPTQHETVNLRALILSRSITVPAVTIALAAFSFGVIEPLLPVRLMRHGLPSIAIGTIFTVSTIVYGLSAPLVGRVSERLPIHQVIVLGTIGMAVILPFLALFRTAIPAGITLSLVNVAFAFMLNPASAELGDAVDRSGLSCYSAVYAVYNIFYSIGMLGAATLASSVARQLGFTGVLFSVGVVLLLSAFFLATARDANAGAPRHPETTTQNPNGTHNQENSKSMRQTL